VSLKILNYIYCKLNQKTLKKYLSLIFLLFTIVFYAQPPVGYYDSAENLNGIKLKTALHNIIKDHQVQTYSSIFQHFEQTDKKPDGKVWDIYSDVPGGTPPYVYSFIINQCGNYSQEGDCFNREHTWPTSWFGGAVMPMYSDLHALYPTDGFVNMRRGNYPYGTVVQPTWTSLNGSKLGPSSFPGYSGVVFEPLNEYKGDLARTFFYFTVRYFGQGNNWPGSDQTIGSELNAWSYDLMYNWHINDPVSQKEIERNNAVFLIQGNRNPFIDNPAWVDSILYPLNIIKHKILGDCISIYPIPAADYVNISSCISFDELFVYNSLGCLVLYKKTPALIEKELDLSTLTKGFYFIRINTLHGISAKKIIIQ